MSGRADLDLRQPAEAAAGPLARSPARSFALSSASDSVLLDAVLGRRLQAEASTRVAQPLMSRTRPRGTRRVPWRMVTQGQAMAMPEPHKNRAGYNAPMPRTGWAVGFDSCLCKSDPYWPIEERARADNAVIGPQTNQHGHLTGIIVNRRNDAISQATAPADPKDWLAHLLPAKRRNRVRGMGWGVDNDGVLCGIEQWLHRDWLGREGVPSGPPKPRMPASTRQQ